MIPSLGRTVLFSLPHGPAKGQLRPAVVVNVHASAESPATESTLVNLQVFQDSDGRAFGDHTPPVTWHTSVHQGNEPGQWRDPLPESEHTPAASGPLA